MRIQQNYLNSAMRVTTYGFKSVGIVLLKSNESIGGISISLNIGY